MGIELTRRSFLQASAFHGVGAMTLKAAGQSGPETSALKSVAQKTGRLVATFSGQNQLMMDSIAGKMIASQFDMLAIGNDLKMNRVHFAPDAYDFTYGDWDMAWSERNGMLFRGHTLVWHMALPPWIKTYMNNDNAQHVMTDHITTVMKHYAGKMYSWDVVNEPVRNVDGRPDGLRAWPWLQPIGPEYIDIAFHTAAAADPKAKLILNENNFEHDLPLHAQRRDTLLQLLTRLKRNNVPVTGLGTQGHIRADTPFATDAVKKFYNSVQDLGLEVMITELDVDDTGIPGPQVDEAVARKYAEYLDLVGPFASVITFEALMDLPNLPRRPDNILPRPNLFDTNCQRKSAYIQAAHSISNLPRLPRAATRQSTRP